jgi:hypothetical protein
MIVLIFIFLLCIGYYFASHTEQNLRLCCDALIPEKMCFVALDDMSLSVNGYFAEILVPAAARSASENFILKEVAAMFTKTIYKIVPVFDFSQTVRCIKFR